MLALEQMVHDKMQPSQLTKKKQNGVKLAKPPTQIPRKRVKMLFFPNPHQRGKPSVSTSIEKATSNEAPNVESFSELL